LEAQQKEKAELEAMERKLAAERVAAAAASTADHAADVSDEEDGKSEDD